MSCLWCDASWDVRETWARVQLWACEAHSWDLVSLVKALSRLPYDDDDIQPSAGLRAFLDEQDRGAPPEPCWKEFTP